MTQRTKGTIPKKNASQIIGIQFSILSPEEIDVACVLFGGCVYSAAVLFDMYDNHMMDKY